MTWHGTIVSACCSAARGEYFIAVSNPASSLDALKCALLRFAALS
jgi:hypothetical protein